MVNVVGMMEDLQALGMKVEPFLPVDGDMEVRLRLQGDCWVFAAGSRLASTAFEFGDSAAAVRSRSDHRQVGK